MQSEDSVVPAAGKTRAVCVIAPGAGRTYDMGRMRAVFKADGAQTHNKYSISEWWLKPNTHGPGTHVHDEDHVYYVLAGVISVEANGVWMQADRGAYIVIPGGTPHDFENRESVESGFMSINVPGGFEERLPGIVAWFEANPLTDATERHGRRDPPAAVA